jgi:hypothetical protein
MSLYNDFHAMWKMVNQGHYVGNKLTTEYMIDQICQSDHGASNPLTPMVLQHFRKLINKNKFNIYDENDSIIDDIISSIYHSDDNHIIQKRKVALLKNCTKSEYVPWVYLNSQDDDVNDTEFFVQIAFMLDHMQVEHWCEMIDALLIHQKQCGDTSHVMHICFDIVYSCMDGIIVCNFNDDEKIDKKDTKRLKAISYLFKHWISIHYHPFLMRAIDNLWSEGQQQLFQLLIDLGADVTVKDEVDETILDKLHHNNHDRDKDHCIEAVLKKMREEKQWFQQHQLKYNKVIAYIATNPDFGHISLSGTIEKYDGEKEECIKDFTKRKIITTWKNHYLVTKRSQNNKLVMKLKKMALKCL